MRKLTTTLLLALFLVSTLAIAAPPVLAQGSEEQRIINVVATSPEFADFLAGYSDWVGEAWHEEDDGMWYVEFFSKAEEDWLGWAAVSEGGELVEFFVPRPLTPEEYSELQPQVERFALDYPEVQAVVEDPNMWDIWTDYNRYEALWEVGFNRGLDEYVLSIYMEDGNMWVEDFIDANAMEAIEAANHARNEAIALAYEAEGIDDALWEVDDWQTYVEQQSDSVYTVEFVAEGRELFYALVDTSNWQVLEARTGQ